MKILVTGGSGFLGTAAVRRLTAAGHDVVVADLREPEALPDGATWARFDVTDADLVDAVVASSRPEVVVHLASIVTPGKGSNRDLEFAVDVTGTHHVVQACLAHGVRRIVVSSSGAAYGYHRDNPPWLREGDPVRGNEEFAYSHHKRLVEESLADIAERHPHLEQAVLRIGTILGESVDNQITALFDWPFLLKVGGADSPFVFIWDEDVAAIIERAATGPADAVCGPTNVAGDGAMTIDEIAAALGKRAVSVPTRLLQGVLAVLKPVGLVAYGPEQTRFLQFRPVLANDRLRTTFGYTPAKTSREAFEAWRAARALRSSE
ncbi:SDR family oxidoreductase [Nocardioides sp. R-C-SC26]|uniref:SDR family oxidoreductase n=1 Tax=Nocardioides sp. R-C-SC26 TaxID=2870414 RepID=UPI001E39F418|nr:SDR family oxidoreductase [Nocardioides sp. R-C-SC26]